MLSLAASLSALLTAASGLGGADRTVTYREAGGQPVELHIFEPEPEKKTGAAMLMLHGGGWSVGSPAWVASTAELVAEHGVVGIPVQYRLSRGEVTPVDAFEDVCAALSWTQANAEELGVDPEKIGFYGVSAGGHLSALTATTGCADGTPGPSLLVLYSPALNMREDGWFIKKLQGKAEPEAMSPYHNVGPDVPPTLIVSGEKDTLTPHRWAVEFCGEVSAAGTRCEIEAFEGVGHLLTRNLDNQESGFNPSAEDIARAREAILGFLREEGFAEDAE